MSDLSSIYFRSYVFSSTHFQSLGPWTAGMWRRLPPIMSEDGINEVRTSDWQSRLNDYFSHPRRGIRYYHHGAAHAAKGISVTSFETSESNRIRRQGRYFDSFIHLPLTVRFMIYELLLVKGTIYIPNTFRFRGVNHAPFNYNRVNSNYVTNYKGRPR